MYDLWILILKSRVPLYRKLHVNHTISSFRLCVPPGHLRLREEEREQIETEQKRKLRFQCPRWRIDKPHLDFLAMELLLKTRSGQSRK